VAAVFVADVSGSMDGSRIAALKTALRSGLDFIGPENRIGLVEFSDRVRLVLPLGEFDLNQKARFSGAIDEMSASGGTAMYDGVLLGLSMLIDERAMNPDVKPLLFALTDGETMDGLSFDDASGVIEGLGIPVYTVGFEADVAELSRLSSLVEAATLNASEEDVEYRLASMFNAVG
jgi:Ca-activated chloride channel family protein